MAHGRGTSSVPAGVCGEAGVCHAHSCSDYFGAAWCGRLGKGGQQSDVWIFFFGVRVGNCRKCEDVTVLLVASGGQWVVLGLEEKIGCGCGVLLWRKRTCVGNLG